MLLMIDRVFKTAKHIHSFIAYLKEPNIRAIFDNNIIPNVLNLIVQELIVL